MENPILENVFGTISLVFWAIQLVPQIYHNYRRHSTAGSSVGMMMMWFCAGVFLCPYSIYKNLSIPLILQAHIFAALCVVCIMQDAYYDSNADQWKKSLKQRIQHVPLLREEEDNLTVVDEHRVVDSLSMKMIRLSIVSVVVIGIWIIIELGFLFWLWNTHSEEVILTLALLSGLSTIIGFVPQYWVVIREKSAKGLSVLFLIIDFFGGVFGIVSLLFKSGPFDYMTMFIYLCVSVGDFGLMILKAIY